MQRSASGNSWKAKTRKLKKWNQTVVVGHTLVQRAKAVHILPLKSVVDLMMHLGSRNAYRATERRCVNANKKKRTVQGSNRPHSVCYKHAPEEKDAKSVSRERQRHTHHAAENRCLIAEGETQPL